MWSAAGDTWTHPTLPYRITREVDPGENVFGAHVEIFEVWRENEFLAVRFSLGAATSYAAERWRWLDGLH